MAFSDYIQSAKKSLSYFGHWLAFTIEQHHMLDTLCKMASSGKTVQLVLLDPKLEGPILTAYARYLGEDEASLRLKINDTWTRVRAARNNLGTAEKKNLELRAHQEFIPYSAFWFDKTQDHSHILIDMKLYGASRKDAYGIELGPVKQTTSRYPSLFSRYASSLERLEAASRCD